jgi:hypothetical protein
MSMLKRVHQSLRTITLLVRQAPARAGKNGTSSDGRSATVGAPDTARGVTVFESERALETAIEAVKSLVKAHTYGENIYAVSAFVTLQRESSLTAQGFVSL